MRSHWIWGPAHRAIQIRTRLRLKTGEQSDSGPVWEARDKYTHWHVVIYPYSGPKCSVMACLHAPYVQDDKHRGGIAVPERLHSRKSHQGQAFCTLIVAQKFPFLQNSSLSFAKASRGRRKIFYPNAAIRRHFEKTISSQADTCVLPSPSAHQGQNSDRNFPCGF